jgi:hypothetical protein
MKITMNTTILALGLALTIVTTVSIVAPITANAKTKSARKPALFVDSTRPFVVMKAPFNQPGAINLFNHFNDATTYSLSMNEILNGSGTNLEVGPSLASENFLQQTMRTLSLFDLYFSYELRNTRKPQTGEFAISVVPLLPHQSARLEDYQFQIFPALLQKWWNFAMPAALELVKAEPSNKAEFADYSKYVRENIALELKDRYPLLRDLRTKAPLQIADYILRSYQPLYSSSWLKVSGNDSFFKSTTLLPAVGALDLATQQIKPIDLKVQIDGGLAMIDRITYGNLKSQDSNVIRLFASRDFKLNDTFALDIDFGRLATSGPNIAALRIDSNENPRHEDALIAHGSIVVKGEGAAYNLARQIMKNFRIEIAVHRIGLRLKRSSINSNNVPGTPAQLIQDIPPFSIHDNLRADPKATYVSFRITTDPRKHAPVTKDTEAVGWAKFKKAVDAGEIELIQAAAQNVFCNTGHYFDGNQCSLTFNRFVDFHNWFGWFVTKIVEGKVTVSVNQNIVTTSDQMDAAVIEATSKVMDVYKQSKEAAAALLPLAN